VSSGGFCHCRVGQINRLLMLSLLTVGICLPRLRSSPSSLLVAQSSSPQCYLTSSGPAWAVASSPRRLPTRAPSPSLIGWQRLQPRRLLGVVMRWLLGRGHAATPRRHGQLDGGAGAATTLAMSTMPPPRSSSSSYCELTL
jgi:hypothetical protein